MSFVWLDSEDKGWLCVCVFRSEARRDHPRPPDAADQQSGPAEPPPRSASLHPQAARPVLALAPQHRPPGAAVPATAEGQPAASQRYNYLLFYFSSDHSRPPNAADQQPGLAESPMRATESYHMVYFTK